MVQEFPNITTEAALLPYPSRGVDHQIDFLARSSLPSLPHYRLSPHEATILQQQVNTLLQEGLVM